jgi:hypothetical protein
MARLQVPKPKLGVGRVLVAFVSSYEMSLDGTHVADVISGSAGLSMGVPTARNRVFLPTAIGVNGAVCAVSLYIIYGFLRI